MPFTTTGVRGRSHGRKWRTACSCNLLTGGRPHCLTAAPKYSIAFKVSEFKIRWGKKKSFQHLHLLWLWFILSSWCGCKRNKKTTALAWEHKINLPDHVHLMPEEIVLSISFYFNYLFTSDAMLLVCSDHLVVGKKQKVSVKYQRIFRFTGKVFLYWRCSVGFESGGWSVQQTVKTYILFTRVRSVPRVSVHLEFSVYDFAPFSCSICSCRLSVHAFARGNIPAAERPVVWVNTPTCRKTHGRACEHCSFPAETLALALLL